MAIEIEKDHTLVIEVGDEERVAEEVVGEAEGEDTMLVDNGRTYHIHPPHAGPTRLLAQLKCTNFDEKALTGVKRMESDDGPMDQMALHVKSLYLI